MRLIVSRLCISFRTAFGQRYVARHELVEAFTIGQPQHGLLHETAKEQRGGQNQQIEEKRTRSRNRQKETKTRDHLRATSKANKSHAIRPGLRRGTYVQKVIKQQ